ncbi:ABC transporter permease [Mycoplasma putrefaciens]|uniref:ABC transporter permease n=1 Tax=Mycoplasma putrefaciens TaxID=2123 RepID=UPI003DA1CF03
MTISLFSYVKFTFKNVIKKKSSIFFPVIVLVTSLIIGIILVSAIPNKYLELISFLYTILLIIITIIFSSIKALNLFKDLEVEGIEILSLSKPISRNSLVMGKLISFSFLNLIWSGVLFVCGLLFFYANNGFGQTLLKSLLLAFVSFCSFFIFGLLTSILSFKLAQKITIMIPLIIFIPLSLTGLVISTNVKTTLNQSALYLNRVYQDHHAGNELNAEAYFLNNQDQLFLIPNGSDNHSFDEQQTNYLQQVIKHTSTAAFNWQLYSWIAIPYQLINVFNFNNKNIFSSLDSNSENHLNNFVYYNDLDNFAYQYKLEQHTKQTKYLTESNKHSYIVPGLLKSHSIFSVASQGQDLLAELENYDLVYAINGVDDPTKDFETDQQDFAKINNLIGKVKWDYVKQVLKDQKFNDIAQQFVKKFITNHQQVIQQKNLDEIHQKLIKALEAELNNNQSQINQYVNDNLVLFSRVSLKDGLIKSFEEKLIYYAVSLMNYIYFNYQNNVIYQAMIKHPNKQVYGNYQYKLMINNKEYKLGGYSGYSAVVHEKLDNNASQNQEQLKAQIQKDLKTLNNSQLSELWEEYQKANSSRQQNKIGTLLLDLTKLKNLLNTFEGSDKQAASYISDIDGELRKKVVEFIKSEISKVEAEINKATESKRMFTQKLEELIKQENQSNKDKLINIQKNWNELEKRQSDKSKFATRYQTRPSKTNFLFQSSDDLYSITRDKKVVNNYLLFVIWLLIITIEFVVVFKLYQRKDYQ